MPERTCTNCGSTIPDGARFCTSCGAEAPAAAPEPHTEPVAPTTQLPAAEGTQSWTPPAEPQQPSPQSWQQPAAPQQPSQPSQPSPQSWSVPPPAQQAPAPSWQQPAAPQQPAWQQQPQQQWGATPAGAYAQPAPKKKGNALGGLLALLGAILLIAGAFTQWVRTNQETISGWEASTDGKIVVGLAVVAVLLGLVLVAGVRNIVPKLVLLALGVWAIVIAVVDGLDVGNLEDSLEPAVGVGLILVGVAGVVLLLAGLVTRSSSKPAATV